ncbi:hypothetical protein ACNKHL_08915 [Shigella flexneri]
MDTVNFQARHSDLIRQRIAINRRVHPFRTNSFNPISDPFLPYLNCLRKTQIIFEE